MGRRRNSDLNSSVTVSVYICILVPLAVTMIFVQAWGLDFLPQKYWAVAGPTYLSVVFVTFVFLVYPSLGLVAAPATNQGRASKA